MTKIPNVTSWRASHSNVRGTFADQLLGDAAFTDSFEEFRSILEEIGKKVSSSARGNREVKFKSSMHHEEAFEGGEVTPLHARIERPMPPLEPHRRAEEVARERPEAQSRESESEGRRAEPESESEEVEVTDTHDENSSDESNVAESDESISAETISAESVVDPSVNAPQEVNNSQDLAVADVALAASSAVQIEGEAPVEVANLDAVAAENVGEVVVAPSEPQVSENSEDPFQAETQVAAPLQPDETLVPEGSVDSIPLPEAPRTVEIPVVANGENAAGEKPAVDLSATVIVPGHEHTKSKETQVMEFVPSEPMPKETFELIEQALRSIFEERSKVADSMKSIGNPAPQAFIPEQFLGLAKGNSAILRSLFIGSPELNIGNPLASGRAVLGAESARADLAGSQPSITAAEASRASQKGAENSQARGPKSLARAYESRTLERVENALKEVVKSRDGKTISFRLDPPSLGTVKIDVSYRDGSLHAKIQPEASQVGNFLRERAYELVGVLRKLGLNVEKITVSVLNFEMTSHDSEAGFRSGSNANEGRSSDQRDRNVAEDIAPELNEEQGHLGAESGAEEQPLDHWVA